MNIPETFKNNIQAVFYDKVINVVAPVLASDNSGYVTKISSTITGSFSGNVQFATHDYIKKQYGIEEEADIIITTSTNINISNGEDIVYLGVNYKVVRIITRDSHILLLGKKI